MQRHRRRPDGQARAVLVQAIAEKEAEVRALRELLRRIDGRVAGA